MEISARTVYGENSLRKVASKKIILDKIDFTLNSNIGKIKKNYCSDDDMKDILDTLNSISPKNDTQLSNLQPNRITLDPISLKKSRKKVFSEKTNSSCPITKEKIIMRRSCLNKS